MFLTINLKNVLAKLLLVVIFTVFASQFVLIENADADVKSNVKSTPASIKAAPGDITTDLACQAVTSAIPGQIGSLPLIGDAINSACTTGVDTVDTLTEFADCATAIVDCVTDMGYKAVGGMVSWAANGVVSLVAGIHVECMPEGGSASFEKINKDCQDRINMDYNATTATNPDGSVKQRFEAPRSAVASPGYLQEYGKYITIGLMIMVPMLIAAAVQAVVTGKGALLLRSVFLILPVSCFGMFIAPFVVKSLMKITDYFSAFILSDVKNNMSAFFTNIADGSLGDQTAMGIGMLLAFIVVALIFVVAALAIWMILNLREVSVALLSVFLPVAFAASIWPALSKWAIRAIKLVVAAIISKIFIVGALSLGIATFSGSTQSGTISFSNLLYGSLIFFIAAFSPSVVVKFFDEIGDAAAIAAGSTGLLQKGHGMVAQAGNANGARALGQSLLSGKGASAAGGLGASAGAVGGVADGASKAMKALNNKVSAPGGGGPKGGLGGGGSKGGGASSSGNVSSGGSGSMPAGADGGHDIGGQTASGLHVPSSFGGGGGESGGGESSPVMASDFATGMQHEVAPGSSGPNPSLIGTSPQLDKPEGPKLKRGEALVARGAAAVSAGKKSGDVGQMAKGFGAMVAGHSMKPLTAAMPLAGVVRGIGKAANDARKA